MPKTPPPPPTPNQIAAYIDAMTDPRNIAEEDAEQDRASDGPW